MSALAVQKDEVNKDTIPIILNRSIKLLQEAKTFAEREEAIIKAEATFDNLNKAKKLYQDLELKLEEAKAEIIIAIDRAKIEQKKEYDEAVKKGEARRKGHSDFGKTDVRSSDIRRNSEKPKTQNDVGINKQRISETQKVIAFDRKNPGVREAKIREMPQKGERVTKGVSYKIATEQEKAEKKDNKKTDYQQSKPKPKSENLTEIKNPFELERKMRSWLADEAAMIERLLEVIKQINEKMNQKEQEQNKDDVDYMMDYTFVSRLYFLGTKIEEMKEKYPFETFIPERMKNDKAIKH